MQRIIVTGSWDDLKSRELRFLQEASRLGAVHVLLWPDEAVQELTGQSPKFPCAERRYLLESVRYVDEVAVVESPVDQDSLQRSATTSATTWAVDQASDNAAKQAWCRDQRWDYHVIEDQQLSGFPDETLPTHHVPAGNKKVIVTGCYDWFHSGHVRFFEEVSELGDLYVVVGHDENIRLLKGDGHPMYPAAERRYVVGAMRQVHQALVSTGDGWLDAEPEIERIRPDMYAVNEDGDRSEKRQYCDAHGIEYVVLQRVPKEGLPKRQSTDLRGF